VVDRVVRKPPLNSPLPTAKRDGMSDAWRIVLIIGFNLAFIWLLTIGVRLAFSKKGLDAPTSFCIAVTVWLVLGALRICLRTGLWQ
jgi:hypothetical protein